MIPRRPNSKKWAHFPQDLTLQIKEAVEETFGNQLKNHRIVTEGRIYPEEVLFQIGFLEEGRLKQPNFEISFDIPDDKSDVWLQLHKGIDLIHGAMLDYLEDEDNTELPLYWKKIHFKNENFYFQFSTTNTELENLANKLLGLEESNLVVSSPDSDKESDDAFELAEIEELKTLQ